MLTMWLPAVPALPQVTPIVPAMSLPAFVAALLVPHPVPAVGLVGAPDAPAMCETSSWPLNEVGLAATASICACAELLMKKAMVLVLGALMFAPAPPCPK